MRRVRGQSGMTLIEVSVTILVICVGTLATLGTYAHFSSAAVVAHERGVLTSVAQREIEQLRPLSFASLALSSSPPAAAATEAPRTGPAATESLVVDSSNGVVRPGGTSADTFTVRGFTGRVYRYITLGAAASCGSLDAKVQSQLAGLFGQTQAQVAASLPDVCPTLNRTKRITIVVVPVRGGNAGTPLYLSTLVNDPSSVTPAVLNNAALSVKQAVAPVAATATPTPAPVQQPLFLYDTRCDQSTRQTPSAHATRDTSQAGFNCTASGPAPTLMGLAAPAGGGNPPDFSTDVTRNAAGGFIFMRDTQAGTCTDPANLVYSNAEADRRQHSIKTWATKPVPSGGSVVVPASGGRASLTLWTATADGSDRPGRLCVTLRRSSNGSVIGSADFKLANWPASPTQLVTAFDLSGVTLSPSERLLLTLRVPSDSGSDIQLLYDHGSYQSNLTVATSPGYGFQ